MKLLWVMLALLLAAAESRAGTEYKVEVSRSMRMYSLIAHCTQKQIVDWKCHLCGEVEQLKDLRYI